MDLHIRYTAASDRYDGFGTETLAVLPLRFRGSDAPYRKVQITDEALNWQTQRYSSGVYPSLDQATFDDWVATGLIVPIEQKGQ